MRRGLSVVRGLLVLFLMGALAACLGGDGLEDHPCPEEGTDLTYDNFGQDFFVTWCNDCHSTPLEERQGAPEDVRFDNVGQVRKWRSRIFLRSALDSKSMPPGRNDPSAAVRVDLADWLACGAPE